MTLQQLVKDMTKTDQFSKRINILEHGQMVKERVWDLLNILEGKPSTLDWKIPPEIIEHSEFLLQQLPCRKTMYLYTILHDCGKPYCFTKDEKG